VFIGKFDSRRLLAVPAKARVALVKVKDFEHPFDAVEEATRLEGSFNDVVKPGSYVTLKPAWVRLPGGPGFGWGPKGMITDPAVVEAVIQLVKARNATLDIVESDTVLGPAEVAFERYGGYELAKKYGVGLVNVSKDETQVCTVPDPQFYLGGDYLKWVPEADREMYAEEFTLKLSKRLLNSTRIVLTPIKTQADPFAAITLSVKNLFGLLPEPNKFPKFHEMREWKGKKYYVAPKVGNACLDVYQVAPPHYAIIDGLWMLHGLGSPVGGNPPYTPITADVTKLGVIIASKDAIAADAVAAAVAGFDLRNVFYYRKAERLGLGTLDLNSIDIVGEPIDNVRTTIKFDFSLRAHAEMMKYPIRPKTA